METKNCKNCQNDFKIDKQDFNFYKKINVPPPTFCPDCRLQRRLAWRNDLSFYNRTCDMCGKNIISLYHQDKPLTVYCNKCWWGDKWDPKSYGKDIDFARPFFEQFRELQDKIPLLSMFNDNGVGSVNCEYTQNTTFAKNCYMGAMTWYSEDVMYYFRVGGGESRDLVDVTDVFTHTEKIYDSIFLESCYNCRNCYYSTGLNDCAYVYDCKGCSDSFMCVNLRQKKYCIKNVEYSKEEYQKILKSYQLHTYSGAERAKKEFMGFLLTQPRRFANLRNCKDSTGDCMVDCKNVKDSIAAYASENMRFQWCGMWLKDSYDITPGGKSEECYEALTADHDYRTLFAIYSLKSQEISYVENCHSSKHLFGCSGIKHGQYSILNKEYTKEEYFKLRDKLIEHMKSTGEYGEFFPSSMSNFGYNETMALEYFPLTKKEALAKGFKWWDKIQKTTGKETIKPAYLPDSILDVSKSILDEVLSCIECARNYKIVQNEFLFYKKQSIPLPRRCFYCRNTARIRFENPVKLWHRSCMCEVEKHGHKEKCPNEFETSYAPERQETIYCESCYNKEVY